MDFDSFSEAAAGAIGGIFSCTVLYPLEVIKNNLQSGKVEGSMVDVAKHVWKKDGAAGFTKGVQVAASCSATEKFMYFYLFRALIKRYEAARGGEKIGTVANLAVGYAADWMCRPVVLPLDTLSLQLSLAQPRDTFRDVVARLSLRDAYSGVGAYVVMCLKPAVQFTMFEQCKRLVVARQGGAPLSVAQAFALGALARAVADTVIFPARRAKVLKQTKAPGTEGKGALAVALMVLRERGFLALYKGLSAELSRGVLSAALMLTVKEQLQGAVKAWLRRMAGRPSGNAAAARALKG